MLISRELVGGSQGPLFTAFGSFALLAMADFGGPPARRFRAYVGGTVAGAAVIAIGTPVSGEPLAAGLLALPVTFAIRFGGSFGAQLSAGVTATTLAFVLAVAVEAPTSLLGDRLLGWAIAGAVATAAALLLWPTWDRAKMLRLLGDVAACFGEGGLTTRASEASEQLAALRAGRPSGVIVHAATLREERCFRRTIAQLRQLGELAPLPAPESGAAQTLLAEIEGELRICGAALRGEAGAVPDPGGIERARLEHRDDLVARAGQRLRGDDPPERVLAMLDESFNLRVVSLIVLAISTNVLLLTGRPVPPEARLEVYPEVELLYESRLRTGMRLARAWLRPHSARLRDAMRASVGLTLAVVVATATGVSHGFWVVLATLVVLRSNARGTGRTAFEVVGGTVVGFVVASILMIAIGTGETGLWIVLPIAVFASTYLPGSVSVAAGQAAFAVFVVVLFNLFEPTGWQVGLVRVEDVVLGAAISLLVGLLLWPRGAAPAIRTAAAGAYRAAGAYLASVLTRAEPSAGPLTEPPREAAMSATVLVVDAIDQHRGEPGVQLDPEQEFALLDGPRLIRAAADGWTAIARIYPGPDVASPALDERAALLLEEIEHLAGAIEAGGDAEPPPGLPADLRPRLRAEAIAALNAWAREQRSRPGAHEGALRLVWERDWLHLLGRALAEIEEPVVAAGRALS